MLLQLMSPWLVSDKHVPACRFQSVYPGSVVLCGFYAAGDESEWCMLLWDLAAQTVAAIHQSVKLHAGDVCFPMHQGRQSVSNIVRVQSPPLLPSPLFLYLPLPLEIGSLNPAKGSGERCKLPQWGLGRTWNLIALQHAHTKTYFRFIIAILFTPSFRFLICANLSRSTSYTVLYFVSISALFH